MPAETPPSSSPARASRRVEAGLRFDPTGQPVAYTLTLGSETIVLEHGRAWTGVDHYKWVTRGLIEIPQSFHVGVDGSVDINGDKIRLQDGDGVVRLEREINKHHAVSAPRPAPAVKAPPASEAAAPMAGPDHVHFRVRVDHLGHLMIEVARGAEKVETGLRGLPSLPQRGLMIAPKSLHIDPLQRGVDLDGVHYACDEAGARQLEEALNARYAPSLGSGDDHQISVRQNAASPTGFDLQYTILQAGSRVPVKGHLSQEKLDLLQDPTRCGLLRPGILLRLSPPNLLVRRRRPDGGDEAIPGVPDLNYLRVTAEQLEQVFNHPLLHRTGGSGHTEIRLPDAESGAALAALRVRRHPQNPLQLWLDCTYASGRTEGRAFTHHNVADLRQHHVFQPQLDVALSLDHRVLSLLNTTTKQERHITLTVDSPDADLGQASEWLTTALKPAAPPAPQPPTPPV